MRVLVNQKLVKQRANAARRAINIGLMLMIISLVFSFNLRNVPVAYLLMLSGIIVLNWGVSMGAKWLREPRADQALAKALKGLNQGHRLYNYLLPAEHVLCAPTSLFVLKVKRQDGKISCRNGKWHRQLTVGRLWRALVEEPLGNPSKQARQETEKMRRFLSQQLPGVNVPMQPLIVFIHPKAELGVIESTVPAMHLSALKPYLRDAQGNKLSQDTLQALIHLFNEQAA